MEVEEQGVSEEKKDSWEDGLYLLLLMMLVEWRRGEENNCHGVIHCYLQQSSLNFSVFIFI